MRFTWDKYKDNKSGYYLAICNELLLTVSSEKLEWLDQDIEFAEAAVMKDLGEKGLQELLARAKKEAQVLVENYLPDCERIGV